MNKFIRCFNVELEYLKKSKILISAGALLLIISIALSFIQYTYVSETYTDYTNTVKYYDENGLDIDEDMNSGEYHLQESSEGMKTIENPILYFHDQVCRAIYSVSPAYAISQVFEISIIFFPLLFFFIGSSIMAKDYKYKIIKHKILRFGRKNYIISKVMLIFLSIIILILAYAILGYVSSLIITNILSKKIPFEKFDVGMFKSSSTIFVKIILMMCFSAFYSLLGAMLGVIFKNNVPGMILSVVYLYIIPLKMRYEPKNMMYVIMKKHFDFLGLAEISSTIDNNTILSFSIIGTVMTMSLVIITIILYKRSAYN